MPLQIQPDESLASYVRRNLHLNWRAGNMGIFDKVATRLDSWLGAAHTAA